ncbi:VanZ family protein [Actinoplanes sp. NPDC049548]|uniref:VanZ family protein n=1 Tax=Actinoplanes sp. NPDC049548 TaxID=3155152 RepID=UPI003421CB98
MGAAWRDHGTTIVVVALVLPVLSLVAYRWRRREVGRRLAGAEVGLVAGSLPWTIMLFTPQDAPRSVDLVPLHDLPSWVSGDFETAATQVVGNLLVLAAFGFFLPVRFAAMASVPRIFVAAVVTSAAVEALQWVLAIGRVSSIDDVLMNTLGAVLAGAASRRWWAGREPEQLAVPTGMPSGSN